MVPTTPRRPRVASSASLYLSTVRLGVGAFLDLINPTAARATHLTLRLDHEGVDVTARVASDVPWQLAPCSRWLVSLAPEVELPRALEASLCWEDAAGIPGAWQGIVQLPPAEALGE